MDTATEPAPPGVSIATDPGGRTGLRTPDPDLTDEQIWTDEAQRDLYGYRRLD